MKAHRILFAILIPWLAAVAQTQTDFTLKKVGDGVYAAINPDGGKAGSNAGFVVGDKAVLVVDTFIAAEPAQQLLAEIRKVTNLPIRYVVNTHYHLDHTGGNAVFAEAGATLIAHRNVREWEHTENLKFFGPNPQPEQRARVEGLALPDVVYDDALDVYLGARRVEVNYMLGHTGGDSVVFVPDANVVFTGDLMWTHRLPNLIDASTGRWIETLDTLLREHPKATFVSGHADVATAADVRDFRGYLAALRKAVENAKGKSGQALLDAVSSELAPAYGSWGAYKTFLQRNVEQTAAELAGTKKIPQAEPAK